jgi:hypothetical protein
MLDTAFHVCVKVLTKGDLLELGALAAQQVLPSPSPVQGLDDCNVRTTSTLGLEVHI